MSQPDDMYNLKVHVRCGCGAVQKFCVPTNQQTPKRLRCSRGTPTGGETRGGGGAVRCPNGHPCGIGLSELRDRALRELEQARDAHVREGAVVIEC